jgi:nucleotide-binding universal stress UspA family protein
MTQHDRISDADLLLSGVLYEHLTAADADATEREILHDRDVVRALIALSAEAALMVVNARGTTAVNGEPLGDTVRGLVGRTACPLAVLAPAAPISVTRGAW